MSRWDAHLSTLVERRYPALVAYGRMLTGGDLAATAAGVQSTPSIFIDGSENVPTSSPAWGTPVQQIQQAVIMKGSTGPHTPQSPSPTPSPSNAPTTASATAPASANSSASQAPSASPAATPSQTP